MRGTILLATALAAPLALPALAQDMIAVAPVYGRIIAHPIPQGFVGAFENEQAGNYILEFIPEGQSVDGWDQMITLTGAQGMGGAGADPFEYGTALGQGFQSACPETFIAWDEGQVDVTGADAAHLFVFACGDAQGVMEMAAILVAQGPEDIYTFQWAERSAPIDAMPELDTSIWIPRAEMLLQLKLCEIVEGEEPPYPSCTG